MLKGMVQKVVGTRFQREMKRLQPIVDEIKIHASALRRAQKDPVSMSVLAAVTGLAHNLGMSVCAEGVEDQATFEFLKTIECDKMQGFLISEAVIPSIIRRVYSAKEATDEEVA